VSFGAFCVKINAGVLAVGDWKNQKKQKKISKNETPYPICIKFFMAVRIPQHNHLYKFWSPSCERVFILLLFLVLILFRFLSFFIF